MRLNANRFHYNATTRVTGCGTRSPGWIFRRTGCYGVGRCAEGTRATGALAKTAAHAGFFLNYPILGIGLNGDHCLSFNCAELPRSKRILEATGYRYPVAFSIGICPVGRSAPKTADAMTAGSQRLRSRVAATVLRAPHRTHGYDASCRLPRRFAAGSPTDYPQVACDRNCKQNARALRQPSAGTMPQLHRAPEGWSLSRASCNRRVHSLSI
ncbi:hypothetical protein R11007_00787 [Ralstonia holmesii]|uniref:Uncharacterized protein n=1 Tax=Ralstonia holmesii TaxID=3058602 RepID=A0ABC8Q8J0_9RALS|nr:hypothetical protein R11007_00787 [Ralstonia sp. LMG 32967]CAJ0777461.1 hypothetical protein LMG18096_00670 [Ralstonia sp. LMG 32967]CAJ0813547.1 hypothetical protein LMG18093_02043 [Ralstonia sp. LMG 32967]